MCDCKSEIIKKENIVGTYMVSLVSDKGEYINRVIISLHIDGIIHVTNEGQDGISNISVYTPFSTQSGNWKIKHNKIYATCINFTNTNFDVKQSPTPPTPARNIVKKLYKFNLTNGILCGTADIQFYPPVASPVDGIDHFMCKCSTPLFSIKQKINGYFIDV